MTIQPLQKNKRNCVCCNGGYVINGDPSGLYQQFPFHDAETEGKCEFCNPENKRWFTEKMKCHDKASTG